MGQGSEGKRHRRVPLLPRGESRQALGHDRHREQGGPGADPPDGRPLRRLDRKLSRRHAPALRTRLRRSQEDQAGPRVLLDHRLRPGRSLQGSRRLRLRAAGDERDHEHHRRTRRPAGRRSTEDRHAGQRLLRRPVRDGGDVGCAHASGAHRRGPIHRHRTARHQHVVAAGGNPAAPLARRGTSAPRAHESQHGAGSKHSTAPTVRSSWPSGRTTSSRN